MTIKDQTTVEIIELARGIIGEIEEKKGENIILLDLRELTIIADYFVLCSGNSERQLKAIVEGVRDEIKKQYGISPRRVDGDARTGWVLLDYNDVMVHVFSPDTRDFYDLEGLWSEAPIVVKIQ